LNSACLFRCWYQPALFISPCQFQQPRKLIAGVSTNLAVIAPGKPRVTGVLLLKNVPIILAGRKSFLEIALAENGFMVNVE